MTSTAIQIRDNRKSQAGLIKASTLRLRRNDGLSTVIALENRYSGPVSDLWQRHIVRHSAPAFLADGR